MDDEYDFQYHRCGWRLALRAAPPAPVDPIPLSLLETAGPDDAILVVVSGAEGNRMWSLNLTVEAKRKIIRLLR